MRYVFKNRFYALLMKIIDFLGNLFLKTPKDKRPPNVGSILVIRLDHIGDVIFSTPVPQNLKEHYKGAKVTFLVAGWAKELVINNPYVDEVICYDAPWFDNKKKKIFDFLRFFKLTRELRKQNYDLGFDLRGDFRHALLMALAKVKFRVGYGITGGGFLLHKEVYYRDGAHSAEHVLDCLRSMNINIVASDSQLYSSDKDKKQVSALLKANNLVRKDAVAVMHPYAGYISKNWLDERFIELAAILYKDYGMKTILVGSEADRTRNDNLVNEAKTPVINLAGKTSLGALFELIKHSRVFIGVDSGPSHIAAATGKPVVILYSGTNDSSEWSVKGKKTSIIQKEIPCKGCEKLDCAQNVCMDLISVEDVLEAVKEVVCL